MRGLLLALLLSGCAAPSRLVVGESLSLNAAELQSVGDRPVLIDVWASWCERCTAVVRRHAEVMARAGNGARHVGWNVDASGTHAERTAANLPGSALVVRDPAARRLLKAMPIDHLPTTLLLGTDDRLLFVNETFEDDAGLLRALGTKSR